MHLSRVTGLIFTAIFSPLQIWDLASGELKLSLTGHISPVRGLAVSDRHPYLFSCGEDKVSLPGRCSRRDKAFVQREPVG